MIANSMLDAVADYVEQHGLSEATLQQLRTQHAGVMFTYCMDDDIHSASPVLTRSGFNVYLVDTRDHCVTLTRDHEIASGVVLAEVVDEE
ncbi:hypothetical protein [Thioflexithrix psekupsensis]|uniref:Uncharacterized protein n=1 Tax=Thioflexithrix psekupsensis TaxID=1570016 RepID=A0A251XCA1_9GAMM|nr:hypothetical protein [Thioflexithrix psekupsensis]OUD15535.1 hypothetical protein TPSD3_03170 [Thioflexithrix psekupsensis]